MLQDSFIESLVVRKNGINGVIFTISSIVLCIILIALVLFVPWLIWGSTVFIVTSTFSVILVFALVWLLKNQHKEYEIEISNDVFDCALITGKEKRHDLVCFSLKDCDFIGPVTSDRYNDDISKADFVVRLTDLLKYPVEDKYWYCNVNHEGRKYAVVFIFKPEMYKVFRRYNPRATIQMAMPKESSDA